MTAMEIFDLLDERWHEQLVFWNEPRLGYRGIIAIHDTTMGPALGGTRFWNYESERDAIIDALRLSRGMTYKAAITGLKLGGGKSVIWGECRDGDREMIFRAHGRAVESLNGRYITAEDVGTSPDDMEFVSKETRHVVGLPGRSGDPSLDSQRAVARSSAPIPSSHSAARLSGGILPPSRCRLARVRRCRWPGTTCCRLSRNARGVPPGRAAGPFPPLRWICLQVRRMR